MMRSTATVPSPSEVMEVEVYGQDDNGNMLQYVFCIIGVIVKISILK